jgi:hypothetical protein
LPQNQYIRKYTNIQKQNKISMSLLQTFLEKYSNDVKLKPIGYTNLVPEKFRSGYKLFEFEYVHSDGEDLTNEQTVNSVMATVIRMNNLSDRSIMGLRLTINDGRYISTGARTIRELTINPFKYLNGRTVASKGQQILSVEKIIVGCEVSYDLKAGGGSSSSIHVGNQRCIIPVSGKDNLCVPTSLVVLAARNDYQYTMKFVKENSEKYKSYSEKKLDSILTTVVCSPMNLKSLSLLCKNTLIIQLYGIV